MTVLERYQRFQAYSLSSVYIIFKWTYHWKVLYCVVVSYHCWRLRYKDKKRNSWVHALSEKNCESFITPNDFTIHEKRVSRVEINPKISWEPKQKNALRGCLVGFSAKLLWSQYRLGDLIFKVICDVCYWRRANDIRWIEIKRWPPPIEYYIPKLWNNLRAA